MKNFISENWFKLIIGTSLLMASFGFMIKSITPASARSLNNMPGSSDYRMVPLNADGTLSVKLSEDQLNNIIPKNEDGSINIRISEKQLKSLEPDAIQSVNIQQIYGHDAASYDIYTDAVGNKHSALGIVQTEHK